MFFKNSRFLLFALSFLITARIAAADRAEGTYRLLPRIGVDASGRMPVFRNSETGALFRPVGSSYLPEFHNTLSPGVYDRQAAERAIAKMVSGGFTVLRIWAYHGHFKHREKEIYGMEGRDHAANTPGLSQAYMDNLCNFIGLANTYGLYVHLVIDREPDKTFYRSMVAEGYPDVEGFHHREYMTSGSIKAKEIYIRELIDNIRRRSPELLSTIFAYEIRNEIHSNTRHAPFNRTSGSVKTASGVYDMGDPHARLACQEDNVMLFLSRTTTALKQADPMALATASVFGFLPVGKAGMEGHGLLPTDFKETRWPIRPAALAASPIDFVCFNSYLPNPWDKALESSGIDGRLLRQKPFVCTEFGAHRQGINDAGEAADSLLQYRRAILKSGFQGAYLFTWDTTRHTRWTMMEKDAVIFERLRNDE